MAKYSPKTLGFRTGILGTLIFGGLQVAAIFRSTSSTASIGLLFVPIWCWLAFVLFFALGYGIGYIRTHFSQKQTGFRVIATAVLVIGFAISLVQEAVGGYLVMNAVSEIETTESYDKLNDIFNTSLLKRNKFVLGSIAGSPKTSVATLRKLEQEQNYLIDWGLAQNRNTPPDVFARLLDRKKDFMQQTTWRMVSDNPSVPADIQNKAKELLAQAN